MKGAVVPKAGAAVEIASDLEVPIPSDSQILVKSIYAALNPVDAFMAFSGTLVVDWPLVLGVDAAGVVVKAGPKAINAFGKKFEEGDHVCGCTRLGTKGYSSGQEFFLMDAQVAIPKPKNISLAQAATIGVGAETACLGIFNGLHIPLPKDLSKLPPATHEWVLVLGGGGSVGKYAVQIIAALGYNVLASCSPSSSSLLKSLGAAETVDYKTEPEAQIEKILSVTGGKLNRIYDTTAAHHSFVSQVFSKIEGGTKYFTTTNDWEPMTPETTGGAEVHQVLLGPVGRPESTKLNKDIERFVPLIVGLIEQGKMKTSEYEVLGNGVEAMDKAWQYQQSGKAGNKKVLVKIGDE